MMRPPGQMLDLSGVAVAVTGAGGLIGGGIAERLAAAGADLVLHHLSSDDACRRLAESVAEVGARAVTVKADLTDRDGAQSVIDAGLNSFGKLDAVVNNAGLQPLADLLAVSAEEFRRIVDVNLVGAHQMTAALARHLIARAAPGSVVHIASIEAVQPARGHAHYSASKAAVVMHAKASALELGPHGIRVNCVSPGVIRAPGIEQAWPEGVSRWHSAAPLERLGEPDDVGDACVFLISPLARWITGINLVVDGGVSASPTY